MNKELFVFIACLAYFATICSAQYWELPEVTFRCNGPHEHHACKYRQLTCDNVNTPVKEAGQCRHGCYCDDGYARNRTGACIPVKNCPTKNPPVTTGPDFLNPPVSVHFTKGHVHVIF